MSLGKQYDTKTIVAVFVVGGLILGAGAVIATDDGGIESTELPDDSVGDDRSDAGYGGDAGAGDSGDGDAGVGGDADDGDTGSGSTGDGTDGDASDPVDPEPDLELDIVELDACGLTCREATSVLVNEGDAAATDVTAEVTVSSGGQALVTDTIDVGDVGAGEEEVRAVEIDIGTANGITVRNNDGEITIETTMIHDDGTDEFVDERNVFVTDSDGDTVDGDFELEFERFEDCGLTCRETTTTITNDGDGDVEIQHVDVTVTSGESLIFEETIDGNGEVVPAAGTHTDVRQFDVGLTDGLTIAQNGGFITVEVTYQFEDDSAEFRTQRNVFL